MYINAKKKNRVIDANINHSFVRYLLEEIDDNILPTDILRLEKKNSQLKISPERTTNLKIRVNPEVQESINLHLISFDCRLTQVCLVRSNVYIDRKYSWRQRGYTFTIWRSVYAIPVRFCARFTRGLPQVGRVAGAFLFL